MIIDPNTGLPVDYPEKPEVIWPTGKSHTSFSEVSTWRECSWRHKLIYIDGKGVDEVTPHTSFGSAIHNTNEKYLLNRVLEKENAFDAIADSWKNNPQFLSGPFPSWAPNGFGVVDDWIKKADTILNDVPNFLEQEFPNWKCHAAEEMLYEKIDNHPLSFKGYIDGVLVAKNSRGKEIYWLIDWKTCGWGWSVDQKRDFGKQLQLILYKHYWSKKHNIPYKDIKCGFILMKRDGKPGKSLELVPVSVGPKTSASGLKVLNNHTSAVKKGFFLKNRSSCKFCNFEGTPDCPQSF